MDDRRDLAETVASGETVFWSRSCRERWRKGATSGNVQRVVEILADCDADTLLVKVDQRGQGACHTGARTCFQEAIAARPKTQAASVRGGPQSAQGERSTHFFEALVANARLTLHVRKLAGDNSHHIQEVVFKAWPSRYAGPSA